MIHRYFPMFSTFQPIRDYVETENGAEKFLGLSAPFPISGEKQLTNAIANAKTAGLSVLFVGFFDPLGELDEKQSITKGGFYSVRTLIPVDSAESFRSDLLDLSRRRGVPLLYRMENKEEGESNVQS